MKKGIKKTVITLVLVALFIAGTANTNSITAKASPYCNHISVRATWSNNDPWLPITYFKDYCLICGMEFGSGSYPGGPFNPYPSNPW